MDAPKRFSESRKQALKTPVAGGSHHQQRGVQTFATKKRADAAADGGSRLRFAQDAHFVFRGVATPLGRATTSGSGCEVAGRTSAGTGAPLRCGSLRSPPLRSAPAPRPLRRDLIENWLTGVSECNGDVSPTIGWVPAGRQTGSYCA
jgi:hypothetical protein